MSGALEPPGGVINPPLVRYLEEIKCAGFDTDIECICAAGRLPVEGHLPAMQIP